MAKYPVDLTLAEEGGFVVTFPDVPEAITQGETRDEALIAAKDALETTLSLYVDERRDLPHPSAPEGHPVIRAHPLRNGLRPPPL